MKLRITILPLILLAGIISGCGSNSPVENNKNSENKDAAKTATEKTNEDECMESFKSAFKTINPELIGLSVDRATPLIFMRDWMKTCAEPLPLADVDQKYLESQLEADALKYIIDPEFTGRDITHIRDAQLFHKYASHLTRGHETNLEKIMRLYEVVNFSISNSQQFNSIIRDTFDLVKFGRGTNNDRAWVYAAYLKQLNIDSFLIVGNLKKDSKINFLSPLLGVAVDGKVYLFDVFTFTPVPAPDDKLEPLVSKPATYDDLVSGKINFNEMLPEHPVDSLDFSSPAIKIICTSSFYSPRMKLVQKNIASFSQIHLYDQASGSPTSQRERVYEALKQKIPVENIGIWKYPEQMIFHKENPTQAELYRYSSWNNTFEMTSETIRNVETTSDTVKPESDNVKIDAVHTQKKQFLTARLKHLNINYEEAIPSYGKIRMSDPKNEPENKNSPEYNKFIFRKNMAADACYFIAITQLENQQYQAAGENAFIYVRKYHNMDMKPPMVSLAVYCNARTGNLNESFKILDDLKKSNQHTISTQDAFYHIRWKKILDQKNPQK